MKAVLTADIVDSTSHGAQAHIISSMRYLLQEMDDHGLIDPGLWQIFRGDSFQFVTSPEKAMLAALTTRAGLRGGVYRYCSPDTRDEMLKGGMDARISIGIGEVGEIPTNLSESYGEAFTLSGIVLDLIELEGRRLAVTTGDGKLNAHFDIICRLTGLIINEWTENSSQAIFRTLLYEETQEDTAAFLGISQSSVHHRLRIASMTEIRYLLTYFEQQIKEYLTD